MPQVTKSQRSILAVVLMLFTLLPVFYSAVSFSSEYNKLIKEEIKSGYYDDMEEVIDELADEMEDMGFKAKDAVKFVKRIMDGNISYLDFYNTNSTLSKYMDDSTVQGVLKWTLGSDGLEELETNITISKIVLLILILLQIITVGATVKIVLMDGKEVPIFAPVVILIVTLCSVLMAGYMDDTMYELTRGFGGEIDKLFVTSFASWFALLCSIGSVALGKFIPVVDEGEGVDMSGVAMAGNELLSNLGQKISTASQGVVAQTKTMTEITSTNGQISTTQKEINKLYQELGESYYNDCKEGKTGNYSDVLTSIGESHKKVAELQERVKQLKGVTKCPRCQGDVEPNAPFCTHCGAEQPKPEQPQAPVQQAQPVQQQPVQQPVQPQAPVEQTNVCPQCQAPKTEGDAFCQKCGTKL